MQSHSTSGAHCECQQRLLALEQSMLSVSVMPGVNIDNTTGYTTPSSEITTLEVLIFWRRDEITHCLFVPTYFQNGQSRTDILAQSS